MKPCALIACVLFLQTSLPAAPPPAKLLDLSMWKLTLPIDTDRKGRPDEVVHPEMATFNDEKHFFVDEKAEAIIFRGPCGGVATKGSDYPRCELREMQPNGKDEADWSTDDDALHSMTVKLAINRTPPVKQHVVCAQIHNEKDDVLMLRLEGTKLFIERNKTERVMLDTKYKLGEPIEIKIQAGGGEIKAWHNGELKMTWPVSFDGCYFRAGCYTQSNEKKGDAADAYAEVAIYELKVEHE